MHPAPAPPLDHARFRELWRRCADRAADSVDNDAATTDVDSLFAELTGYYREPHRHYHTEAHIHECLSRMDLASPALGRSDGVELAVWFHDAIYQPGAADNEARSAQWFARKARGALNLELIGEVEGYILATTHCDAPTEAGARFVVDVDLSGMGMDATAFQRDGDNIRKEAAALDDAEFCRRQGGFLRKLLARERIYTTDFFHDLCEARARENIHAALTRYKEVIRAAEA
ncbi:MAG: HD domain-containing protein [bacterium]